MNLLKTNSNNDGGVNIPFSNNLIKDKLEEIFVVFGMIFNEEQFFMKFKNYQAKQAKRTGNEVKSLLENIN